MAADPLFDTLGRVAVVGLGITGRAVADALTARSIEVVAIDDRPSDAVREWSAARSMPVRSPGDSELATLVASVDAVVPAPGLPDYHRVFEVAAGARIPIVSEFDLAAAWDDRPVVAVTGTDGKTTVVTLITAMLEASGIRSADVGNTDTPWVHAIDDRSVQVFVVEASSFRLGHSRRFSPSVAVWLNFGPDHLDAHADLGAYEAAKAAIWAHLEPGAVAIANRDDPTVAGHAKGLDQAGGGVVLETFGAGPVPPHGVVDDQLMIDGQPWLHVDELARRLPHDQLNALAATAAATAAGADLSACAAVLRTFAGLPHRVEEVGEIDGVAWVNDSKATTPHAAATAMSGFDSIVLLAGGRNKGLAFDDMIAQADRVRHVVALGDAADDIAALFRDRAPVVKAESMAEAVELAAELASPGDTVLLSPACASFDWYPNYRARGDHFRRLVHARICTGGDR